MERYRLISAGAGSRGTHPGAVPVAVRVLVGDDLTKNVRVKLTSTPVGVPKGGGHKHERCEHVAYIVSGQARIYLDQDPPFLLRAGDTLYVAAGVFHDVEPVGDEPLVTLMVDVPPED
jgi:mannose-6-phosphate isomerase-like protein (cupin superfamily)